MTKQASNNVSNDDIMTALTEFAQGVDKRFDSVDKRFDSIDKRFDSVDKRFEGVYQRFDRLEAELGEVKADVKDLKSDVNRIYGILDAHMARIEKIVEENMVQTHQQARLERWIFQLADEAGVKLKYEA